MSRTQFQLIRRGLTLIELMMALVVTAMVAAAVSGMLGAVTAGVDSRRDNRDVNVRAHAAQSRLAAYIAPSRCVLDADADTIVIWLHDERASETVHATELRWIVYDNATNTLNVHFVAFPDGWTKVACDLADREYAMDADWDAVLSSYASVGHTATFTLVDNLAAFSMSADGSPAMSARHLVFDLGFGVETNIVYIQVAGTIRRHLVPSG